MVMHMIQVSKMMDRKKLRPHQEDAVKKLRTGSILLGGVGSGKTLTSLVYFNKQPPPKPLYVITTARKRDSKDWEEEALNLGITDLVVDSWNNIKKYKDITNAFFIFDEQKVVGYGAWSKSFLKITKNNKWILLTATPGDTWMDYVSIFIANGFYKNKTDFIRQHVVFNTFTNYPKVDRYVGTEKLERIKNKILVRMKYERKVNRHHLDVITSFDPEKLKRVIKDRWNIFKDKPIRDAAEAVYTMRRIVNSDPSRLDAVQQLMIKHKKVIIFYNFDYELEILRTLADTRLYTVAEYNGHLHEDIPKSDTWAYLVQYLSGAEAWNCVTTNTIIFYSLSYSYKQTTQAAGRIDRMTSPFGNLYYYYLRSDAPIDLGILHSLKKKTNFNEQRFVRSNNLYF